MQISSVLKAQAGHIERFFVVSVSTERGAFLVSLGVGKKEKGNIFLTDTGIRAKDRLCELAGVDVSAVNFIMVPSPFQAVGALRTALLSHRPGAVLFFVCKSSLAYDKISSELNVQPEVVEE